MKDKYDMEEGATESGGKQLNWDYGKLKAKMGLFKLAHTHLLYYWMNECVC